jgi:hypothetical protein
MSFQTIPVSQAPWLDSGNGVAAEFRERFGDCSPFARP